MQLFWRGIRVDFAIAHRPNPNSSSQREGLVDRTQHLFSKSLLFIKEGNKWRSESSIKLFNVLKPPTFRPQPNSPPKRERLVDRLIRKLSKLLMWETLKKQIMKNQRFHFFKPRISLSLRRRDLERSNNN